jgi:Tfp pilus assembly protein PilW
MTNPNQFKSRSGMTLVEMIVSMGCGMMILAAIMVTCVFVAGSFAAIGNYSDLDKMSRSALDNMSRNIRNADHFATTVYTNSVTMTNTDGTYFSYTWDPSTGNFSYISNGASRILLTNCDILNFQFYSRVPGPNFTFTNTANGSDVKMVSVAWRCSRTIYGKKINTESVQTAKIVVRN